MTTHHILAKDRSESTFGQPIASESMLDTIISHGSVDIFGF